MKQKQQIIVLIVLVSWPARMGLELRNQAPPTNGELHSRTTSPLGEDNPQIRWAEFKRAQETEYKSNGRNPFSMIALPPAEDPNKPKPTIVPPQPVVQVAPQDLVAKLPPNLKYFGYGTIPKGTPRRAFITDGEEIFIVSEGDTLLGRYRILKVGNANLEFQEISSGLHGTTPLEEQAATPSA